MHCRVCDANDFSLAIDLGYQPWGNHFLKAEEIGREPFYPLRVLYCHNCQTAQLDYTVKKEVMFSDHTYLSGVSQSLHEHFQTTAEEVDRRFFADQSSKNVLDIGSNDGTQLQYYKKLGYEVCGVESSKRIAEIAKEKGIPTLNFFFNLSLAEKLQTSFDVINASGVFFHLEELHSVTQGIKKLLKEKGVFVVQFLYMKRIMENCAFDQIYHEHLLFYTLRTLNTLLDRHELSLFDAYLSPIHGGSIIAYVSHPDKYPQSSRLNQLMKEEEESACNTLAAYRDFAKRIEQLKERNLSFLKQARSQGKSIFGMGAPVKGNTLLNYFGIGPKLLDRLVEKNPLRKGLFSPGMHIPVFLENDLVSPPDVYYVLAWNLKKEILRNNQELIRKGVEFYFPVEVTE